MTPRTTFLAIGECMIEMAPQADGHFALGYAGDTFNTAWYARRLLPASTPVAFLTATGTDAVSTAMTDFMTAAGIDTGHVARHADRTVGLYMIRLHDGERSFAYWRSQSAARRLADDRAVLDRALRAARLAYLSGITLAILPPAGRTGLLAALRRARADGCTVVFDPNLRPALWPDSVTMCASVTRAAQGADIILPSFDDEATHFGDADPTATTLRYASGGASLVVVKNGAGPVTTWQGGSIATHAVAPVADVIDTTAAGDSFNAAFLAGWQAEGANLARRRTFAHLADPDQPADTTRHIDPARLAGAVAAGAALAARVVTRRGALVDVD